MITKLPKNRQGKTDWQAVYQAATPGQRLTVRKTLSASAYHAASRGPYQITIHGNANGTVDIVVGDPHPPKAQPVIQLTGPFAGLTPADVIHKITDAEEQFQYWTRYRAAQSTQADRIAAGARVQLWTMQLASLRHYLNLIS